MMGCDELVQRVRLVINEAADDDDVSLLSPDTRSLDDSIKELLPQAVSFIQKNKGDSAERVNCRSVGADEMLVTADSSGGGLLVLPDDFAALVEVQLKGWMRPAPEMHPHNSREAMWQRNEHTRAGNNRPVCVETIAADGERCALLFPFEMGEGAKLERFIYEASFNEADGLRGYDDAMADAVVYKCASLLYTMFERYDAANAMLALAMAACGRQMGK